MGGLTFENTIKFNKEIYEEIYNNINNMGQIESVDYMIPLRLENKKTFGDFDLITYDIEKIIEKFSSQYMIKEIKKIPLFEERFGMYSKHILTENLYQIDILGSWNQESMEITRAFFSYSFANIFLKRLTNLVDRNLKFSYLGLMCSSNKFAIPPETRFIQIDNKTKLIIDCDYVFGLLDLDYNRYKLGFKDEFELLEYFSRSRYFSQIKFSSNSKFKHDYSRLKPFANLVDLGLIKVENFTKNNF